MKVNLGTEFTERNCNPLVNETYRALSLDAHRARFNEAGVMVSWPGDTEQQNEPTSISPNFTKEIDARGRTWARMAANSFASGLDCRALAGNNTIIAVSRPDLDKLAYYKSFLSGRSADGLRNWQHGWYEHTGVTIRSWQPGYYGMFAFSTVPQTDGAVSTMMRAGDGTAVWSNGEFANWIVTPPDREAQSGGYAQNTELCGIGGLYNDSMQGLVGEVRIYAGALSNAQREMLQCQLGEKWGIGVKGCKDGRPVETF